MQRIVTAIKASPAWSEGHNAIVVVWDENDYSTAPNTNQVLLIVDTNYGAHGVNSASSTRTSRCSSRSRRRSGCPA